MRGFGRGRRGRVIHLPTPTPNLFPLLLMTLGLLHPRISNDQNPSKSDENGEQDQTGQRRSKEQEREAVGPESGGCVDCGEVCRSVRVGRKWGKKNERLFGHQF